MMADPIGARAMARAKARAAERQHQAIARLVANAPPGVTAEPLSDGVRLSAPHLRWRWLRDAQLRSFWR